MTAVGRLRPALRACQVARLGRVPMVVDTAGAQTGRHDDSESFSRQTRHCLGVLRTCIKVAEVNHHRFRYRSKAPSAMTKTPNTMKNARIAECQLGNHREMLSVMVATVTTSAKDSQTGTTRARSARIKFMPILVRCILDSTTVCYCGDNLMMRVQAPRRLVKNYLCPRSFRVDLLLKIIWSR